MSQTDVNRLLPVKGVYNMRDIGGYKTKDNKTVKWGKIIRSGDMAELTQEDLDYLSQLPVTTIIDFRSKHEKDVAPDKQPESSDNNIWIPIDAGDVGRIMPENEESVPQIMIDIYKSIIYNSQKELKDFFRILENNSSAPIIYHCSAGKDRTEIATALLLYALGVDKETIMHDYMLSAEYIKGKYDFVINQFPALAPLVTVQPQYLESIFNEIESNLGGMEAYLQNTLEVDIETLKKLYLE